MSKLKKILAAMGEHLAMQVPGDSNRSFWINYEPGNWRTDASKLSADDVKYICDTAEKIFLEVVTLIGTKTTDEAVQTMLEGHYLIAERMLAKRKAYVSKFESRD